MTVRAWLLLVRVLSAATVAVVVSSCGAAAAPPEPPAAPPLAATDWSRTITDLDCSALNRGIEVLGVRFSDLRTRGVPDAYVWVDCFHDTSPWPHQLEVFDGASDPNDPRRLAVLIPADAGELIRSVDVAPGSLVVGAVAYADDDARCCPSLPRRHEFTWTGDDVVER